MKKYIFLFISCLFLFLSSCFHSPNSDSEIVKKEDPIINNKNEYLESPKNLKYDEENYVISWDKVDNASSYTLQYNGDYINVENNEIDILDLFTPDITYDVSVCAVGNESLNDSDFSNDISITINSTSNLKYLLLEDGTGYSVSRGNINFFYLPETIIIPDMYNGLPVLEIADTGFSIGLVISTSGTSSSNKSVKRIRMPKYLKKINEGGFTRLSCLEKIEFTDSLEIIGDYAFSLCESLTEIKIPQGIKKIGKHAFGHTSIEEIYVPNIELGNSVFYQCVKLRKIIFDDNIKVIPDSFCYNSTNLEEVILPNKLEKIGYDSFYKCECLKKINIPQTVTYIGKNSFRNCKLLDNVIIPDNINFISKTSFEGTAWFDKQDGILVKNKILIAYFNMPENCDFIIPENVEIIADSAFSGETNLVSIIIPETVKGLFGRTFNLCKSIKRVTFNNKIDIIDSYTFNGCNNLEQVILPDTIKIIKANAFSNCYKLEKIDFPDSLEEIEKSAFIHCKSLKSIDLNNVKKIGDNSFGFSGLKSINLNIEVSDNAFSDSSLEYVIIGKKVTNMPFFCNCKSLKEVFYSGTQDEYNLILRNDFNKSKINKVLSAKVYFYSENEPNEKGIYWHYVDGIPTIW